MGLPSQVILEDHDLEDRVGRISEKLAKLRWHWTLDESNLRRVSIKDYARQVARDFKTVYSYAHGYADSRYGAGAITLNESIERAKMSGETAAATGAVAEARGLQFKTARQTRSTEVRRVREMARDRAEKHGTTVEEEAPKVAQAIVRAEKAGQKIVADRQQKLGLRFVEMEGKLDRVKRELVDSVRLAQDIEWGTEETELLQHTLANIKALLHLIDTALTGTADIDWDTELARLTKDKV